MACPSVFIVEEQHLELYSVPWPLSYVHTAVQSNNSIFLRSDLFASTPHTHLHASVITDIGVSRSLPWLHTHNKYVIFTFDINNPMTQAFVSCTICCGNNTRWQFIGLLGWWQERKSCTWLEHFAICCLNLQPLRRDPLHLTSSLAWPCLEGEKSHELQSDCSHCCNISRELI